MTRLERVDVINAVVANADPDSCFISGLGYLSRDFYAATPLVRDRCFYCLGSMGSVAPLAIGLALAGRDINIVGLEGDASLMMNLGTIATLKRYATSRVSLVIMDNGCHESTGQQISQPDGFKIEHVIAAAGIDTHVAQTLNDIAHFFRHRNAHGPSILVAKTLSAPPVGRVTDDPEMIANRFATSLQQVTVPSLT